jgi:hypothetical protein
VMGVFQKSATPIPRRSGKGILCRSAVVSQVAAASIEVHTATGLRRLFAVWLAGRHPINITHWVILCSAPDWFGGWVIWGVSYDAVCGLRRLSSIWSEAVVRHCSIGHVCGPSDPHRRPKAADPHETSASTAASVAVLQLLSRHTSSGGCSRVNAEW